MHNPIRTGTILALILALILTSFSAQAQTPKLYINEYLASNSKLNADPDFNEYGDWVEIYNAGDVSVPLVGYYLTDDLSIPSKWKITANVSIAAKSYLVIWADDKNTGLHANYKLSADGEQIGLYDYALKLIDSLTFSSQTTNISCGRYPDGAQVWNYFSAPTPGASNSNLPFDGIVSNPQFSLPGGFYKGSQTLTISDDGTAESIRYTTDGSNPADSAMLYANPISLTRTTVLRAQGFRSGHLPSRVVTQTFFIDDSCTLPVVSLSTDPANLWDDKIGIYVTGTNGITGYCSTTPCNWNQDWERPATLEYFDEQGKEGFQLDAGIKIGGGCTRKYPQKPIAVYARSIYGSSKINYRMFADKDIEVYNNLMLSNSGQDWYRTLFRDGMMQNLVKDRMDIDWQAYKPAVLFINGEYWGIHSIREKHNEHYLEANYGVDPDRVDILSDNATVHEGSAALYKELIAFVGSSNLAASQNYDYVKSRIDINEYLNYMIAEIYFANIDWPGGNIKYWRPQGEGHKWRWILYDTDLGFGAHQLGQYNSNSLANATSPVATYYANPTWSTLLLRKLLENEEFKNRFIQRFAGHIQTTFEPARVVHKIDSLKALLAPEIPRHKLKWPTSMSFGESWDALMEITREFGKKRPEYVMAHIAEKFALTGTAALTVKTRDPSMGRVAVEGVTMPDSITLAYFVNIPINCVALPAKGYRFAGWQGLVQSPDDSIRITLTSAAELTALFAPAVVGIGEKSEKSVEQFALMQNFPNPFNPVTTIAFILPGKEFVTLKVYDILGAEIASLISAEMGPGKHSVSFNAERLTSGVYFYKIQAGRSLQMRKMVVVK